MAEILYKDESYRIIGSSMKVHQKLGPGFLESVYSEALEIQFNEDSIPCIKETKLRILYNDKLMNKYFKADFLCFDKMIVELKATPFIHSNDVAQVMNYLKATGLRLGILVNFGEKSLTYKRVINLPPSYNSCNS